MTKLYGYDTPNVLKINIMLEEIGDQYDIHRVDIWQGEQFTDEFVDMSPNSKIPVLVDEAGVGEPERTICESGAILFYLVEKNGKFFSNKQWSKTEIMQWMMFSDGKPRTDERSI